MRSIVDSGAGWAAAAGSAADGSPAAALPSSPLTASLLPLLSHAARLVATARRIVPRMGRSSAKSDHLNTAARSPGAGGRIEPRRQNARSAATSAGEPLRDAITTDAGEPDPRTAG